MMIVDNNNEDDGSDDGSDNDGDAMMIVMANSKSIEYSIVITNNHLEAGSLSKVIEKCTLLINELCVNTWM